MPVVQTSGCFMKATFFYLCKFLCLNCNLDLTFSVIDGSELGSPIHWTRNFLHVENIVPLP